jgi:hypothetical protein
MTGEIVGVSTNPSQPSDSNRSCMVSAIIAGVPTIRLPGRRIASAKLMPSARIV